MKASIIGHIFSKILCTLFGASLNTMRKLTCEVTGHRKHGIDLEVVLALKKITTKRLHKNLYVWYKFQPLFQ